MALRDVMTYFPPVKPTLPERDELEAEGGATETGYADWKRAKVEKGLAQSRDRKTMIPIEQIWSDLKLER